MSKKQEKFLKIASLTLLQAVTDSLPASLSLYLSYSPFALKYFIALKRGKAGRDADSWLAIRKKVGTWSKWIFDCPQKKKREELRSMLKAVHTPGNRLRTYSQICIYEYILRVARCEIFISTLHGPIIVYFTLSLSLYSIKRSVRTTPRGRHLYYFLFSLIFAPI